MPILCFEGPSAVGKTTVASALSATAGAYVVPEVNLLFARPAEASPAWYFERQVERWTRAAAANVHHPLVLLDGDPFQPLWYNWTYGYAGQQDLTALEAFYRPHLIRGTLRFPDRYVVFGADEATLRARKAADTMRQRRNFDKHLRLIGPQRRYFAAMHALAPERVVFLNADTVETAVRDVRALAAETPEVSSSVALFDQMTAWLRTHAPTG